MSAENAYQFKQDPEACTDQGLKIYTQEDDAFNRDPADKIS